MMPTLAQEYEMASKGLETIPHSQSTLHPFAIQLSVFLARVSQAITEAETAAGTPP